RPGGALGAHVGPAVPVARDTLPVPVPQRSRNTETVALGGTVKPFGPGIIAPGRLQLPLGPARIDPAPVAVIDDREPVLAIAVAVIGIAHQERPVGIGFVIVIAVAAIDGLGVAIITVAGLPCPWAHAVIGEAVIRRSVAQHPGQRDRQGQRRIIAGSARCRVGGIVVIA